MKIADEEIRTCAGCSLAGVRKARHDGRLKNLEDLVVFCLSGRMKKLGIEFLDDLEVYPANTISGRFTTKTLDAGDLHYVPDDEHVEAE